MDDKLTSQIGKLVHELEEIRVRALTGIISKLDLNILTARDLISNSDIFVKLVEWFEFSNVPCKKDVLQLIIKLAQERDGAFYLQVADPGLARLKKSVGAEYPKELAAIHQCIDLTNVEDSNHPSPLSLYGDQSALEDSSQLQIIQTSSNVSSRSELWEYAEVYWPVPELDDSDVRVLNSVAQLLSDKSQSSQVANFFSSVLLHDFPPQVFLHNTSILNALFKLYKEEGDHQAILRCFKELTLSLHRQLKCYEDSASVETIRNISNEGEKLALCEWDNNSQAFTEQLGVGEYCAHAVERLGHQLPSALRLLHLVIGETTSFWEATSGGFLKASISNHLLSLVSKLKAFKVTDPLGRLEMQIWVSQVLTTLIPESVSSTVIPHQLQSLLLEELYDPCLALIYPKIHNVFKRYVSRFQYLTDNDFDEVEELGESLKAAAKLIKEHSMLSASQILTLFHFSLSSLDIHHNYDLIRLYFKVLSEMSLLPSEYELSEKILLILISHLEDSVKEETFSLFASVVTQVIGHTAAANRNNLEFGKIKCVLTASVLKEIINFGLTSPLLKVSKASETIWLLILKAKFLLNNDDWSSLLSPVISCFSLLQAFAGNHTSLGRTILQMFDPDVFSSLNLHKFQVLVGNVRFLFSKDRNVSSEGYTRLIYLLGISPEVPFTFPDTPPLPQTISPINFFNESNLPRLVELLRTTDGKMLRSAVIQIGLLSEQTSLHIPLLEAGALPLLLDILHSSLNNPTENTRDLFASIILVLKNLAFQNIQIRNDFSVDYNIYCAVLKGLFTLSPERRLVNDGLQLLTLMAYSDCIVISEDVISFPQLLVENLKLPFYVRSHSTTSNFSLQSRKCLLSRREVRHFLGVLWCSTIGGGPAALMDNPSPPPAPLELPPPKSFLHLPTEIGNCLIDLKTASSHQVATSALLLISRYLRLSKWSSSNLQNLSWEESFRRYLTTFPSSPADQLLLIDILRVLIQLISAVDEQVSWLSSYISEPSNMLSTLLSQAILEDSSSIRKELSLELLALVENCLNQKRGHDWDGLSTILLQSLNLSHSQKFYTLAVVDRLLRCLLLLSGCLGIPGSQWPLWKLLAAFHCPSSTSFMGLTITRRVLFSLNSVLACSKEIKVYDEAVYILKVLSSRDWLVVGSALELSSRLSNNTQNLCLLLQHIPGLWDIALSFILDHKRSSAVREQAAFLCCNIVNYSQNKNFVADFIEKEVFKLFSSIFAQCKATKKSEEIFTYHSTAVQESHNDFKYNGICTKKLVTYICCLCMALMIKDKKRIVSAADKAGFIPSLGRDLSEWRCEKISDQETVDMYESVLRILVHSHPSPSAHYSSASLQTLIWILLPSSYVDGLELEGLTIECLRLLALLATREVEQRLIIPEEAVILLKTLVCSSKFDLSSAAAAAITSLGSAFSQRASLDLLEAMGTRNNMRPSVASILGNSHSASLVALELGLLVHCLSRLTELQLTLALTPRNTKKSTVVLETLSIELRLLTNFLAGCEAAKVEAANLGLADSIHKLWVWTLTDFNLLSIVLRTLITFTADCPLAAGTLVLTSTLAGVGQRKSPTSMSLLHAIIAVLTKEIYPSKLKMLFIELISHACQSAECRHVIAKSNFLVEFLSTHAQKKSIAIEELEAAWLKVLTVFTYYPEGQTSFIKSEEAIETLVDYLSGNRSSKHQKSALGIIRNLTFNQNFRRRLLLNSEQVLESVGDRLADFSLSDEELTDILVIVWILSANNQKGKGTVRALGLASRIDTALRVRQKSDSISSLTQLVLPLLQN